MHCVLDRRYVYWNSALSVIFITVSLTASADAILVICVLHDASRASSRRTFCRSFMDLQLWRAALRYQYRSVAKRRRTCIDDTKKNNSESLPFSVLSEKEECIARSEDYWLQLLINLERDDRNQHDTCIRKWQDNQMESSWTHVNHEVIELEKWTKRKWNDIAVEWRIDDPSFKNSTLSINLLRHPVYHHQEEGGVTKWSQLSLISYPDYTINKYHSISGIPLTTRCTFASSKIVF